MKIAIAGAFGFIGQHLISALLRETEYEIAAFSRLPKISDDSRIDCVTVDLYSLKNSIEAFKDCDVAVYMVHSMAPSSRLTQGHFRDYDYILADNFARAAKANGIRQIIYVGGIIPNTAKLSMHLKSRLEVEKVIRSYQIPVTTFRCGLVIGPKGSSFNIIVRLVTRLRVMLLPRWMTTLSSPIYVEDLVKLMICALRNPSDGGNRTIDAGSKETVTYRDIVKLTAKEIGRKLILIDVPYVAPQISKLWVRLISGASKDLVYPLIDSVKHEMLSNPKNSIPTEWDVKLCSIEEAVKKTFSKPLYFEMPRLLTQVKNLSEVRSVQRINIPTKNSAEFFAKGYFAWLPLFLAPFIKVVFSNDIYSYQIRLLSVTLLSLKYEPKSSTPDRALFKIREGLLVGRGNIGRLEFRIGLGQEFLIVALHNYRPSLPWPIYRWSQAILHKIVMKSFAHHLMAHGEGSKTKELR